MMNLVSLTMIALVALSLAAWGIHSLAPAPVLVRVKAKQSRLG